VDKHVHRSRGIRDRRRTSGRPSRGLLERWADERLVELVLAGDETAFEELFERHAADALWFARDVLGSWGEAEDAVRHSFAAAHAYLASRDPDVEFAPWLRTILTNHCLSMLQARTPDSGQPRGASVVDLAAWRRRRRRLLGALPLASGAGSHEGLLAACGLGAAGVGTTATPLLGGTLAKITIVAVLATGVGVAGDVATQRVEPPDAGVRVVAERSPGHGPAATPVTQSTEADTDRSARVGPAVPALELPTRHPDGGRHPAAGDAPAAGSPVPAALDGAAKAPAAAAPVASPDLEAAATPLQSAVDAVRSLASASEGGQEAPVAPPPPVALDLREIGDHLGVSSVSSPVDVGDLLTRLAGARGR
jgi:hypothetical protein